MKEQIDLVVTAKSRPGGVSLAVVVSFVLHSLLILWVATRPPRLPVVGEKTPIARYVELMRQNPQEFTEAPGPAVDKAPMSAPYSDANRRASMPEPTGDQPTKRPGDGGGLYTPPSGGGAQQQADDAEAAREAMMNDPQEEAPAVQATQPSQTSADNGQFAYREPIKAGAAIDWRAAMKQEARKIASLGNGQEGVDLRGAEATGGEKGFAESGPLSFETQWYDWGPYAQSMVGRIRVNWHEQMPMALLRTGLKGVVTIRFTIHRDGRISDISLVNSSSIPPYDFAARKAIELSSPLNPLPKDFPNPTERVTCMFYYNMQVPK